MQFDSIDNRVHTLEEERKLIEKSEFWKKHLEEHTREHTVGRLVVLEKDREDLRETARQERAEQEDNAYFEKPIHMGCACGGLSFTVDEKGEVQPYAPGGQEEYTKDTAYASGKTGETYK